MKPTLADAARTMRFACLDLPAFLGKLALAPLRRIPSSTTEEGRARVSDDFRRSLARLGVELEVLRADAVPRTGGLVFMWNQESHLDHFVLGASIPRPFFSLYNNEVKKVPFYGPHMEASGHVHVDRNDEAQWRVAIAGAAKRVHDGECVLVSPEGTRSRGGALLPMKRGAFILAMQAQRPIVCVTVIGGHARLGRDELVVRGGPMRVVLGDPIPVSSADAEDEAARTALMDAVTECFAATKRAHPVEP